MSIPVTALAVAAPSAPFAAITVERREPGPKDVLIDIAYAGVCHSDLHMARNDWGFSSYPLLAGHEITGVVTGVGSMVTRYAFGDRVAVGNLLSSCRECSECRAGREQYCRSGGVVGTAGASDSGGFSQKIVVDQDFVLRVPDGMDLAATAPLLCAGITMYSALRHWKARPGTRVAIVGLGGLGHLGVQLAVALGAEVTVLSRTLAKAADSKRFGATRHLVLGDDVTAADLATGFDLIISTLSSTSDTAPLLAMLDTDGTLVMAGAPTQPLTAPVGLLIGGRRSLAGTSIGGLGETQEMLDFCAAHNIAADVKIITADQSSQLYDRLDAADVRYRLVIDTSTL